jgi:hypothetical protein
VLCRHPENQAQSFEVEDNVQRLLEVFEDLTALIDEHSDFEDGIPLFVHEFEEALDERSQFLPRGDDVSFFHWREINYYL